MCVDVCYCMGVCGCLQPHARPFVHVNLFVYAHVHVYCTCAHIHVCVHVCSSPFLLPVNPLCAMKAEHISVGFKAATVHTALHRGGLRLGVQAFEFPPPLYGLPLDKEKLSGGLTKHL